MSTRYIYKGKDLSTLVLSKVEHVASMIAQQDDITFESAFFLLIQTKTFEKLIMLDTLLWSESAEYIVAEYYEELSQQQS